MMHVQKNIKPLIELMILRFIRDRQLVRN